MIKAKPLIWIEPSADNNWVHMAEVPWGTYYVHVCGGRHMGWLEACEKPYERECGEYVGSVIEAQMQCQSHADQLVADMAQPVTPEDAARVLLEYLQNLDESHVWEQAQKAQEALMSESADVVLAALRAIATPPQEKDDG